MRNTNIRKTVTVLLPLFFLLFATAGAQQLKETVQELSKPAKKGLLNTASLDESGKLIATYQMKVDKKSDQVNFEDYVFDANLGFSGIQPSSTGKASKPDQRVSTLAAYVGGSNSFNVMSMSLTFQREEWEKVWDYQRQGYRWGKRLSKESVKPGNSEGKYTGFAAYQNDDEGSVCVLASAEQGKNDDDRFLLLYVNSELKIKETPLPLNGAYTLVYTDALSGGNAYAVFAPNKGMVDTRKYQYIVFSGKGDVVSNAEFNAPSSNLLIMDGREINGSVYFMGASGKSNDAFNQEFSHYAPIQNPGFSTSANKYMDKYERKVDGYDFEQVHLLKFTGSKLDYASTTPVGSIKQKLVLPEGEKKADPWKGQMLLVKNMHVTAGGDCFVTGQLQDRKIVNGGKDIALKYYNVICMRFGSSGELKSQYTVERLYDDSKSEYYSAIQSFYPSRDGQSLYWELLDVKGVKGYESFADAYLGNSTITPNYFPRIAKINLQNNTVSAFRQMGEKGKYMTYRRNAFVTDEKNNTRYYIGHDEDYEKLWIGKCVFE